VTASGIANFENFSEGTSFKPSFTDPRSGITFSNSTAFLGNFVIEYATNSTWSAPMFQNNRYLVANGYVLGNGASLPANFGFTAMLPQLALLVELDVVGNSSSSAVPCGVSLLIQDSGGATISSQTATLTSGSPQQYHLKAESPICNFARFLITTSNAGFDGVDNINVLTPEPSAAVGGALLIFPLLWRGSGVRDRLCSGRRSFPSRCRDGSTRS
jgi:hypothetical protein